MFSDKELQQLVKAEIVSEEQAKKILNFKPKEEGRHLSFANTMYYLGGFIIVFAISYFLGTNWEELGDFGRIVWTIAMMVIFGGSGLYLRGKKYKIAGALLLLAAVASAPLFIHSVERAINLWPTATLYAGELSYENFLERINTAWVVLDVLSLIVASLAFYKFREPILSLPVAHFFWFLTVDAPGMITKIENHTKSWITVAAGLVLVLWGVYYNRKKDTQFGVWPWMYGLTLLLGGLISLRWDAEPNVKIFYQLLVLAYGMVALFAATPLKSKTFLVFGAIGTFWFIEDIAWTYFAKSLGFSLALAVSGFLTIGFGMLIQDYYKKQFSKR